MAEGTGALRAFVPLCDIRPSETNPRRDFGDIHALAETIRATGGEPVNPPVLVRDGRVCRIVDGERRYRALCEIYGKDSTHPVRALVYEELERANESVAMLATDDKRQLSEEERARGVQQMLLLGVDEGRIARASRATAGQVGAVRRLAGKVPEGVQPTLEQFLAADELGGEDAERVLASTSWRLEVSNIRERRRSEEKVAKIRRRLESLGVEVVDEAPEGTVRLEDVWDPSPKTASELASRMPEGAVAVLAMSPVRLAAFGPQGSAMAPRGPEVADPDLLREGAAVADLMGRALRFVILGEGAVLMACEEAVRLACDRREKWARDRARNPYARDLSSELEEMPGNCGSPSLYEVRAALVEEICSHLWFRRAGWMTGKDLSGCARDFLDAADLLAAAGMRPEGDDTWLSERLFDLAEYGDGGE